MTGPTDERQARDDPTNGPGPASAGPASAAGALTLRPLAGDDLDAVHRLEVASSASPWSRELLAGELSEDDAVILDRCWLVATDDENRLAGFGGVLLVADEAHVMNIAVDHARRRHGIASRLLAELLLVAGDRGSISATLEVRAGNTPAIGLYRRFGFDDSGRRPRYYSDGEDALIMWLHRIDRPAVREQLDHLAGRRAR